MEAALMYCECETPIINVEFDDGCRRCGRPIEFSKDQPVACDGCQQGDPNPEPLNPKPFLVTNHEGEKSLVHYCEACADLAACDWNGETAAISPCCWKCGGGSHDPSDCEAAVPHGC